MARTASVVPGDQPTLNTHDARVCIESHLQFGWWSLLAFLSLGIVLEGLHGFKVGWYLDVSSETRRLLFTLAHAHGTLLALLNLAFAFTVSQCSFWPQRRRRLASSSLKAATLLLPGGFLLGGMKVYAGDPGMGIVLVPLGAVFLIVAVFLSATAIRSSREGSSDLIK